MGADLKCVGGDDALLCEEGLEAQNGGGREELPAADGARVLADAGVQQHAVHLRVVQILRGSLASSALNRRGQMAIEHGFDTIWL